jgi:hypothetical protein
VLIVEVAFRWIVADRPTPLPTPSAEDRYLASPPRFIGPSHPATTRRSASSPGKKPGLGLEPPKAVGVLLPTRR